MSIGGGTTELKPCTIHDLYDGAQPPFVACRWCEVLHKKSRFLRGQVGRAGLLQVREFERVQARKVASESRWAETLNPHDTFLVKGTNWLRGQWD